MKYPTFNKSIVSLEKISRTELTSGASQTGYEENRQTKHFSSRSVQVESVHGERLF